MPRIKNKTIKHYRASTFFGIVLGAIVKSSTHVQYGRHTVYLLFWVLLRFKQHSLAFSTLSVMFPIGSLFPSYHPASEDYCKTDAFIATHLLLSPPFVFLESYSGRHSNAHRSPLPNPSPPHPLARPMVYLADADLFVICSKLNKKTI